MSSGSHLGSQSVLFRPPARTRRRLGRSGDVFRVAHSDREARLFATCLLVLVVHIVDVALVHRGRGGAGGLLLAAIVLTPVLLALFLRRGRIVRAVFAAAVGLTATTVGLAVDLPHVALAGAGGSDYSGILSLLAGIVLVGLAFRLSLRGRRPAVKVTSAIVAAFAIAQWLIAPAINAGLVTNASRPAIASARTLGLPGAQDVSFTARDGVRLSGWYVPGRGGAAVILLHGSHGTRADTLPHLRMLAAAGYGVLAYDARGHGRSGGQTNALGWQGSDDLAGAVSFLSRQAGLDPRRIAALGLSMGAEESLRAAARRVPLAAVIADGAGASTLGDSRLAPSGIGPVFVFVTWLTMRATELISGEAEPAPLNSIVARVQVPTLLIASNRSGERAIDEAYRERIGARAQLWFVSDAAHTRALQTHPNVYAARVTEFLGAALTPTVIPTNPTSR